LDQTAQLDIPVPRIVATIFQRCYLVHSNKRDGSRPIIVTRIKETQIKDEFLLINYFLFLNLYAAQQYEVIWLRKNV